MTSANYNTQSIVSKALSLTLVSSIFAADSFNPLDLEKSILSAFEKHPCTLNTQAANAKQTADMLRAYFPALTAATDKQLIADKLNADKSLDELYLESSKVIAVTIINENRIKIIRTVFTHFTEIEDGDFPSYSSLGKNLAYAIDNILSDRILSMFDATLYKEQV